MVWEPMKDGIKKGIEAMGVRFGKPLSGYEPASRTLETCEGFKGKAGTEGKRVREQAVPVAQVEDAMGKTGVAYVWNTGELELSWI